MNTLVTGATGFIGSHFVEELLKQGEKVTCLVRKNSNLKLLETLGVKLAYGDCLDKASLLEPVANCDYVYHLAGLTKAADEKDFFLVNAKGTENLISALAETNSNVKRFVYMSSLAAAGPSLNGTPVSESSEPKPVSSYGKSKLDGEKIVLKYNDRVPVTIIRPPAVYGPRDKDVLTLFKMIKKGIYVSWGNCYYSFVHVEDLVKGTLLAAENKNAAGKIYNISDCRIYSNSEIAEAIASALGKKPIKLRIPRFAIFLFAGIGQKINKQSNIVNKDKIRELRYSNWTCDSSKAKTELGFISRVGIKEGVQWTADWYRIHQWL